MKAKKASRNHCHPRQHTKWWRGHWHTGATASTVLFAYDQDDHLLGEYDSTGTPIREYVWLGNTPVAIFTPDTVATNPPLVYYVNTDHLNTPRVVFDTANRVRWRWLAEPFGTTAPETNPSNLGSFTQNLRFPGQYADQESGLFYNHQRDYDPSIGRYVQSDPIGLSGGINTYAYVSANPLSLVDPTGECPWCIGAAIGFGFDLVTQSAQNGGNLRCVNVGQLLASAALGAVGGGLGGRGLTTGLKGLSNGAKGQIGEGLSVVENTLKGSTQAAARNSASIPGQSTLVDSTWRSITGAMYYVESKFGTSTLTKAQRRAAQAIGDFYHVERWGYPFFGRVGGYLGGTTAALLDGHNQGDGCSCQ